MGGGDGITLLDDAIVRVRFAPQSQEQRSKLRMIASRPEMQEPAAAILGVAVSRALIDEPAAAPSLLEVLVHVHDLLDQQVEAVTAMEQLVALAPEDVRQLQELAKRYVAIGAWLQAAE